MHDMTLEPTPDAAAREILARVFGFPDFRPGQGEIVAAVQAGRDVLAIMPTRGGKSLLYQLPALVRPGVTLVISPLIALMRDQVGQLVRAGVSAASLNSMNTEDEAAQRKHFQPERQHRGEQCQPGSDRQYSPIEMRYGLGRPYECRHNRGDGNGH